MKQIWGMGLISEKAQALYVQLNERAEQPPVVILQRAIFTICLFCACG